MDENTTSVVWKRVPLVDGNGNACTRDFGHAAKVNGKGLLLVGHRSGRSRWSWRVDMDKQTVTYADSLDEAKRLAIDCATDGPWITARRAKDKREQDARRAVAAALVKGIESLLSTPEGFEAAVKLAEDAIYSRTHWSHEEAPEQDEEDERT
jgi:hypothetical protein